MSLIIYMNLLKFSYGRVWVSKRLLQS